ncbi:Gfo/Idh/MocA family oxidoreductase [Saccharibacillus sp. CPCC 101409]|uniref:Gfo/Idh/MocA family protein n=1 Tax=Saccharibacillus sp. CPCC 101409 TaxID=3058041 RepID=UPI00267146A0|nr:Gfo/Idh/MocA family oxidoreductase [Saccharibacillus sp. CPCC 101409]MDO3409796.1 Gfo/Idh/MocA family oxidoreductase [Saccharibacillus sp. CPCC 101409]
MGTIKLAVIGLGNMGRSMIHRLVPRYVDRVELVALCDSSEESLRRESEAAGGGAKLYTDYRTLLAETDADLVYIAVPPSMHFDAAKRAFERGMHVFCEKPLANSLEEAEALLELARNSDRLNVVHFSFPLEPAVLKFKQLIEERFPAPTASETQSGRSEPADSGRAASPRIDLYLEFPQWPRAWQRNDWISTRREGGYLLEVGIHWIHMIQQVFGPIAQVRSDVRFPDGGGQCESTVEAVLRLEDEREIYLSGTDHRDGEERVSLVVRGEAGTVALENWGNLFAGAAGEKPRPVEVSGDEESGELPIFKQVLRILDGQPGTVYDFRDGYNAQVVLEALRNPAGGWTDLTRRLV